MAAPRVLLVDDEAEILQGRAGRSNTRINLSVDPAIIPTAGLARIQRLIMNPVLSSLFILYLKPAKGGSYGRA